MVVGISSEFLQAGLNKALIEYTHEIAEHYRYRIEQELECIPEHEQEWHTGSFLYREVRIVLCWGNVYLQEIEKMATRKGRSNNSRNNSRPSFTFVRCELRKEDKDECKAWIEKNSKTLSSKVHSLMGEGHKISLSLSTEKDTFTASATGQEDSSNEGLILTARHKDWYMALSTLVFKHENMFENGIWATGDEGDDGWS